MLVSFLLALVVLMGERCPDYRMPPVAPLRDAPGQFCNMRHELHILRRAGIPG